MIILVSIFHICPYKFYLLFANDLYRNEKNTANLINQIVTSALFTMIPYPSLMMVQYRGYNAASMCLHY